MEIHRKFLTRRVPPSRSLKVIGTDTDRSATYDFLLVIGSNRGPIIAKFSHHRALNAPAEGFPSAFCNGVGLNNYNDAPTRP